MKRRKVAMQGRVTATQLAQMGTCERMVWLEHRLGRRRTAEQASAAQRGLTEHTRFFDESQQLMAAGSGRAVGRCFVATLLLANDPQSLSYLTTLRAYRDLVMKRSGFGRLLVLSYYRVGPALCRVLNRHAWLQRPARCFVLTMVDWAAASLDRRGCCGQVVKPKATDHVDAS